MKDYIKDTYRIARISMMSIIALIMFLGSAQLLQNESVVYNGQAPFSWTPILFSMNTVIAFTMIIFLSYIKEDFERPVHQAQLIALGYKPNRIRKDFESVIIRDVSIIMIMITLVGVVVLYPMLGMLTFTQWLALIQIPISLVCLANVLLITFRGMLGLLLIMVPTMFMNFSLKSEILTLILLIIATVAIRMYGGRNKPRKSLDF